MWERNCGTGLVCQYSDVMHCSGRCVEKEKFNMRRKGENCGRLEGKCGKGLKCRIDPCSLRGYFESGNCVTDEEFRSRDTGDTCGPLIGECIDGLKCAPKCWLGIYIDSVCRPLKSNDVIKLSDVTDSPANVTQVEKSITIVTAESTSDDVVTATLDTDVSTDAVDENNPVTSTSDTATIHLMNGGRFKELEDEDVITVSDGTK